MQKSLPKKVEIQIVKDFLNEVLDTKFQQFETRLDEKFEAKFGQFEVKFGELSEKLDVVGALINNTHQEIKHFMQLHEVLDQRLVKLEGEVSEMRDLEKRVTALEEKLAH